MKQSVNKSIFLILVLLLPIMPYSEATGEETNQSNSLYSPVSTFYPFNGEGHHPISDDFNKVGSDLSRISPSSGIFVDDYISRVDSPSAREISNALCREDELSLDPNGLSDFNWIWGQFLSHDISFVLTQNGRVDGTPETMHIPIPAGDEWMDPFSVGSLIMPMDRSVFNTSTGTEDTAREFPNSITGWLDGSHVYGSSVNTSNWLRSHEDGKLKTYDGFRGEFLPLADDDDPDTPPVSFASFSPSKRYVAGDPRANEHAALTAIHVLFVREHNRLAEEIAQNNPSLLDEEIYQLARKINTAQMQYITYYEYLPSLGVNLPTYLGFDSQVDPRISNSFAVIAFRMGHSQITDSTLRLDEGYQYFDYYGNISMADGFWNPDRLNIEGGIAPIFRGAAMTTQAASDTRYTDGLRNSMFGDPGFGGLDMCAIDIQRGRGHGLPDYNTLRSAVGLNKIENWSEITSSESNGYQSMMQVYPDIDNADPIMGMYAETHLPGGVLGETMHALLSDQYLRLRDGDPLYFENDDELQPYLTDITKSNLAKVILRNTEITAMQCDAMYAVDSINDMDCFHSDIPKYNFPAAYPGLSNTEQSMISELMISFTETTQKSGLSLVHFEDVLISAHGPTLSLGDCNNDGYEDIWVGASYDHMGRETETSEVNSRTYLFLGDGTGNFRDFSDESGLLETNSTALSATWVDYDNDGDLDLYQSNHGISTSFTPSQTDLTINTLYSNNGNCEFNDATSQAGLGNPGFSSTSSWGDYDNDGDLDLYSANLGILDDLNFTIYPQSDILYHNFLSETGSAHFEDYSTEVGGVYGSFRTPVNEDELTFGPGFSYRVKSIENPSAQGSILPSLKDIPYEDKLKGTGATWASLFVDLNSDGGDDLLIGADFGISGLYKNLQNGKFILHTEQSGIDISGTAMGFDAADFDGDLDLDYCQTNFGPNYIFEQIGDLAFEKAGPQNGMDFGVAGQTVSWDCNFLDVDLDGDLDLWFGSGNINPFTTYSPNAIYINDGTGKFSQATGSDSQLFSPIGKTMGSVWADFDKDGDLDVIISQSNTGVHYFENNAADNNDRNWIGIDVWQNLNNDSIKTIANGAIVDIYLSNGKSVRQVVKIGSGYAGSKDTTIHLGVPQNETITKVVVKWKDGTIIEYEDLGLNQYHDIELDYSYTQQESTASQDDTSLVTLSVFLLIFLIAFVRFFPRQE